MLTENQINNFKEYGYVVLDDILDVADTDAFDLALRQTIRAQINKANTNYDVFSDIPKGRELDLGIMALETVDHAFISDISDFMDMSPELLRLSSTPAIHKAALQLLNIKPTAPCYITNCGVVLAMPFDRIHTYGWHKDTYYTLPLSKYVQMWAPVVEDAIEELGTLEVCPRSHLVGAGEQHAVDDVPNRHRYRVNSEAIEKYKKTKIKIKVGQVLLFDAGLAHRSGSNQSDRARFSVVSVYHQVDNEKIRPVTRLASYKGKDMDEYFFETCGVIRLAKHEDTHFSPLLNKN